MLPSTELFEDCLLARVSVQQRFFSIEQVVHLLDNSLVVAVAADIEHELFILFELPREAHNIASCAVVKRELTAFIIIARQSSIQVGAA